MTRRTEWISAYGEVKSAPCAFYIKGNDLVLVDGNGKFASVMKGGVNNKRYKSGTARGDRD